MRTIYNLSLVSLLLCAACGGSGNNASEETPKDSQMVAEHVDPSTKFPAQTVQTDTLASDGSFWKTAYASGQEAIQLAELATKKAGTAAVKKAAQTIWQDHQRSLQTIRSKDTSTVKMSEALNDSSVQELTALSGTAFDKAWVEKMILKNDAAISRYEVEKDATADKDNRKLVIEILTVLKKHQQLLEAAKGTNK